MIGSKYQYGGVTPRISVPIMIPTDWLYIITRKRPEHVRLSKTIIIVILMINVRFYPAMELTDGFP